MLDLALANYKAALQQDPNAKPEQFAVAPLGQLGLYTEASDYLDQSSAASTHHSAPRKPQKSAYSMPNFKLRPATPHRASHSSKQS